MRAGRHLPGCSWFVSLSGKKMLHCPTGCSVDCCGSNAT
jgi:hypothetical protein